MGRREVRHNWAQFLAIIGIGAIASTLFIGLQANATSIENRVETFYSEGKLPDIWLTTGSAQKSDLNDVILPALNGREEASDKRFEMFSQIKGKNFYCVLSEKLPTLSTPTDLYDYTPDETSGHYFIVDHALSTSANLSGSDYQVGTTLPIDFDLSSYGFTEIAKNYLSSYVLSGGANVLAENKITIKATVNGTMNHPENITQSNYNTSLFLMSNSYFHDLFLSLMQENYNETGVNLIFSSLSTYLGWGDGTLDGGIADFPLANQYLIKLKDSSQLSAVEKDLTTAFSNKGTDNNLSLILDKNSQPFAVTMQNDVSQARSFCYVFPFVFFFTALLVILTTISQMVLKERTQIGTLKAMGVKNYQIYGHYMGISMSLVAIGTLIGEVLGPLIIPNIMNAKYNILYVLPAMQYTFPVLAGVLTAVVFLGVSALVTLLVSYKEVRLKPAESMRPEAPKMKSRNTSTKKTPNARLLSVKMAFRNIVLDPVKSLMVICGVAGCTALLACGYGIGDTVDYGISHDLDMFASADVTVTTSSSRSKDDLVSLFDGVNGIKSVEPYSRGSSSIKTTDEKMEASSYFYVLTKESDSKFKVTGFLDNEVALSDKIAKKLNLGVGDSVSFTMGSTSYTAKIGTIYSAFSYNGVVLRDTNTAVFGSGTLKYANAWVDIQDGFQDSQVADDIAKIDGVSEAVTKTGWISRINDIVSGISIMTNAVKVFAILLALVVLYNLALLSFKERTRDIATLKVLGFSRTEIASSLLWESLTLTFVGVGIGLALGFPFLELVMNQNIVDLVQYLFTIKPLSYVYSFLLTFVVAIIVNVWLSNRTKQVAMVESLKSVE
jgi:putative ABC transport system permease protein